ncbi:uncharacterized protein LOC120603898 [Pteropus medius]|uniref:uncharacterized protein LOC120603898 n=1 Tax=Pteropus vampyrus TaxID=132908 RepID=UPI00196A51BA|nr:uncharacterized protein LOC120603898 [Pteropus giganteus]
MLGSFAATGGGRALPPVGLLEGHAEPGARAASARSTLSSGCSFGLPGCDSAGSLRRDASRCCVRMPRQRGTPALAAPCVLVPSAPCVDGAGSRQSPSLSRSNTCWCSSCCGGVSGGDSTSCVPSCWPWVTPEKNFHAFRRRGLPVGEWGRWCWSLAGVRFMWPAGDMGQGAAKSSVFRVQMGLPPRDRWCEVFHRAAEMPFTCTVFVQGAWGASWVPRPIWSVGGALCVPRPVWGVWGVLWVACPVLGVPRACPVSSGVCGVTCVCPVLSGVYGVPCGCPVPSRVRGLPCGSPTLSVTCVFAPKCRAWWIFSTVEESICGYSALCETSGCFFPVR